ncbi:MAG: NUDIX domain-containing protein [bacterium]
MLQCDYKFCPCCASLFTSKRLEGVERLVCSKCGFIFYQNPTPAVAVILFDSERVLLVKRKFPPRAGHWSLPAGFIEYHERVEETALREIKEETNLDIKLNEIYGIYSAYDDPDHHILLIVYWGEILKGKLIPGDDALDAQFFPLEKLPEDIAFSTHRFILNDLKARKQKG